jgi:hypothetical protein
MRLRSVHLVEDRGRRDLLGRNVVRGHRDASQLSLKGFQIPAGLGALLVDGGALG